MNSVLRTLKIQYYAIGINKSVGVQAFKFSENSMKFKGSVLSSIPCTCGLLFRLALFLARTKGNQGPTRARHAG